MDKSIEIQKNTLQLICNELDARVEACYDVAMDLKEDEDIKEYVNTDFSVVNDEMAEETRNKAARALFSTIMSSNDLVSGSCLIQNEDEYVIQNLYAYAINSVLIDQILKEAITSRFTRVISIENQTGKTYYFLYTPVYQKESRDYSHLLLLLNERFVLKTVLQHKRDNDSIIITDENGDYVYYSDYRKPDEVGFDVSNTISSRVDVYRNQDKLALATHLNKIGWSVSLQIPKRIVFEELYKDIAITATIIIIALVIVFGMNYMIASHFNKRIRDVTYAMERIKDGELDYRYNEQSNDEISQIGHNLNEMVERIKTLLSNVSNAELRIKEAQLKAIQRQINPHFLYNTLETIRMIALYNKDMAAARMTKGLADLFRYNLSKDGDIVSIEQELDYTLKYIDIQKVRYKGKFSEEIDFDSLILGYCIPRMVLQPFVENAFFHGIEPSDKSNIPLRLIGRMVGQEIILEIQDEGIGMSAKTLEQGHSRISKEFNVGSSREHLGLINVNERLKIFFNIEKPIDISSQPEKGTTITLRFPAARFREE